MDKFENFEKIKNEKDEKMVVSSTVLLDGESINVDDIGYSTKCSNVSTFHGDEIVLDEEENHSTSSSDAPNKLFTRVVSTFAIMFFLTFFAIIIFTLAINKRIDDQIREKYFTTMNSSIGNSSRKANLILASQLEDSSDTNHNQYKSIVNVDFSKESYRKFQNYVKQNNKFANSLSPNFT